MANKGRQYLLLADEDLMSLTDAGAFAGLYDRHGRAAYSLAYRMMGERQAAENLVQEAFLQAWRAAGSYRAERGSVRTWVLSIVHHRGIDQLRSSASRRRTQVQVRGVGFRLAAERSLLRGLAQLPKGPGQGGPAGAAAGATPGAGARVLLRVHPQGDSRASGPATRDRKGSHEARAKEDPEVLRLPWDGGARMSGERRNRFDDLKEAYALGALTEDERQEFENLLGAHPELQAEIDDLESTANLLALAPQEQEPSPELRRNLLSSIGAEDAPEAPLEATPRRAGLFGPAGYAAGALAAVAAFAVVGLLVWNVSLRGENEDLRGEAQSRQIYELQGSGTAQDVRGEVVMLGDGRAVLMAEDMPSASEDEVYEAWLLRDGVPEPAGLFEPHDGAAAMPIEGSVEGADAVAVTLEPAGGSSMPTSEPLLTATL